MPTSLFYRHPALRLVPIALLFFFLYLLSTSPIFGRDAQLLSMAITIDILITVPLLYFLLIRKTTIPNITTVPVVVGGMLLGGLMLPEENQEYLELFRTWGLPFVELGVITYIGLTVRKAVRKYGQERTVNGDFFTALKSTTQGIAPGLPGRAMAMEIAVIYYGLLTWQHRPLRENEFTYHRESGGGIVWIIILFLVGIETLVFHLLLVQWSAIAAWVFSALSIYSGLQVLGIFKATFSRPILISEDSLILRYGLMNEITIPFRDIDSLTTNSSSFSQNESDVALSPLGELENQNILLVLKGKKRMLGLYGISKEVIRLKFHVDQPEKFSAEMTRHISDS